MLRRLHKDQPDSFAFAPENQKWAQAQISKFPEGRQASAIIPLLWRAQEQDGWLSRPAIEHVAAMLDMAYIRALEVATFYFMFQLQPVGSVAHIQICGTLSCMICGAEDLIGVCQEVIAPNPHEISADGKFSWEEVECLGACANAPMAQIGKDYYEDLTTDRLREILVELGNGQVPVPGPQNGRYAAEPLSGLTSLNEYEEGRPEYNASAALATDIGDTVKRIDGSEVPLLTPWLGKGGAAKAATSNKSKPAAKAPNASVPAKGTPAAKGAADRASADAKPADTSTADAEDKVSQEVAAKKDELAKIGEDTPAKPQAKATTAEPVDPDSVKTATNDTDTDTASKKSASKPSSEGSVSVTPTAGEGQKPQGLNSPRGGQGDDLKQIKGIGPGLERMCNALGIYHFDQIAAWGGDELAWIDQNLKGFKGRASRDNWIDQAKVLATGGATEFSDRVKKGTVYD